MSDTVSLDSPRQLSLNVSLRDDATFDNFYLSPASNNNRALIQLLQNHWQADSEKFIFLWGAPGSGITHLLQAACHHAYGMQQSSQYLPLRELAGFDPTSLLTGIESQALICIDSLDEVLGNRHWEAALFDLYHRILDCGQRLIISATAAPKQLPFALPDLASRMSVAVIYQLEALDDDGKVGALQNRAKARGMGMSTEVAKFILTHAPRDTNDLFYLLQRLDEVSLEEQRKLTIPLVKKVLGV